MACGISAIYISYHSILTSNYSRQIRPWLLFYLRSIESSLSSSQQLVVCLRCRGCEEDVFDPKTDFVEKTVVFAALDASEPYQTVRLESSYDAEVRLPIVPTTSREITEADVWINSRRGGTWQLKDTLIKEPDGSMKTIWISRDLIPREATTYSLRVTVPGEDQITASMTVPSRAYIRITPVEGGLRVSGLEETSAPPGGFYFRLFVVGDENYR